MYQQHDDGAVLFGGKDLAPSPLTGYLPKGAAHQYRAENTENGDFIEFSARG